VLQGVSGAAEPSTNNVAQQPIGEEKEATQGHNLIALANEAARYGLCCVACQQSGALVALGERLKIRDNSLKQCLLHGMYAFYEGTSSNSNFGDQLVLDCDSSSRPRIMKSSK
jgi:hypothetical protein